VETALLGRIAGAELQLRHCAIVSRIAIEGVRMWAARDLCGFGWDHRTLECSLPTKRGCSNWPIAGTSHALTRTPRAMNR
jgi:hypothetical protein